ncbi:MULTISPECIES: PPK2 family polyphosphate kinase [Mumia]|uniref:PPK2 family polyphosphate kinase n=1 Tax=Mumia TaxID=1546255 RepID=UPI001AB0581C|nr:PPK2 family polyphosphate kinase [Mumia sp. ZJ430]
MATTTLSEQLRVLDGPVDLTSYDSRATPGFAGSKKDQPDAMAALAAVLADRQERLYAAGAAGVGDRRVLLVLQGMDTSGKGGTIRHAAGMLDPQGVQVTSFKAPTPEELEHDFLWRVERALPSPGRIAIFDRSHYEDVLIGRVRALADPAEIERRYDAITAFEKGVVDDGCVVVKCFLHITPDDQLERLRARLDDPTKHWKYHPADVDERMLWPRYREAYEVALERCSTSYAPWFVVPSGRKWYRNWAVAQLLAEHLGALDLEWPTADFDVEAERERLDATATVGTQAGIGTRSTAPTA